MVAPRRYATLHQKGYVVEVPSNFAKAYQKVKRYRCGLVYCRALRLAKPRPGR
ncbi:MAG: hypothetical protein ACRYFZ_07595 [Janthinobacterium lividum]